MCRARASIFTVCMLSKLCVSQGRVTTVRMCKARDSCAVFLHCVCTVCVPHRYRTREGD